MGDAREAGLFVTAPDGVPDLHDDHGRAVVGQQQGAHSVLHLVLGHVPGNAQRGGLRLGVGLDGGRGQEKEDTGADQQRAQLVCFPHEFILVVAAILKHSGASPGEKATIHSSP